MFTIKQLTEEAAERIAVVTWACLVLAIVAWLVSTFAPADVLVRFLMVPR